MFSGVFNNMDPGPKVIVPYDNIVIIIIYSTSSVINVRNKMYSEMKPLSIKL